MGNSTIAHEKDICKYLMHKVLMTHEEDAMLDPSLRLLITHRPFAWYWSGQTLSSAGSEVAGLHSHWSLPWHLQALPRTLALSQRLAHCRIYCSH